MPETKVRQTGSLAEQRLLRLMLHERGFKITSFDETEVFLDEEGRICFDIPDRFWMNNEEMKELRLEFYMRKLRA